MNDQIDKIKEPIEKAAEPITSKMSPMMMDITVIALTLLIGLLAIKITDYIFKKFRKTGKIAYNFLNTLIKGFIILVMIFKIGNLSQTFQSMAGSILMSSSLIVAVLAFAFQKSLEDLIAGFMISVFRPFEVGDRINFVNMRIVGYIEDISLRHTTIRTFTNSRLIVPNSVMNKEVLENSHIVDPISGGFLDITIAYTADIDRAMEIMVECVESDKDVLDIRPINERVGRHFTTVFINELSEYGVNLRVTIWTANVDLNFETVSRLRKEIVKRFVAEGIEIASLSNNLRIAMENDKIRG
ncbi:transporter, small conductance mechanosensitive ion channel MscS family protein [Peptoniphilus duerdenii ATCC BAA-1640]|uniref:Transporter, small conductance mechanosensitive ion channel MscS family protein n=2 Tax=Peptoniphilus TaxID=162289 RepID=E0NL13_9FIRM|nr:mechanosensitive ion channel family protein [Peptoniphilus duerdenii]EFM25516.1 transporter, small conductance mechanosensitive ion channel MscS family protein [Peptoniphilus duerdenii ATCC BAA-1640]